jgi:hypothetical protein
VSLPAADGVQRKQAMTGSGVLVWMAICGVRHRGSTREPGRAFLIRLRIGSHHVHRPSDPRVIEVEKRATHRTRSSREFRSASGARLERQQTPVAGLQASHEAGLLATICKPWMKIAAARTLHLGGHDLLLQSLNAEAAGERDAAMRRCARAFVCCAALVPRGACRPS